MGRRRSGARADREEERGGRRDRWRERHLSEIRYALPRVRMDVECERDVEK